MLIHCTKKLLDELGVKPSNAPEEYNPLFSWRAHFLMLNRRKSIVLMCDSSRYVVVLHGLKAKELRELGRHVTAAVREALLLEQINPEIVERYLQAAGEPVLLKNGDRKQTARLNKACELLPYMVSGHEEEGAAEWGRQVSRSLVGDTGNDYFQPNERMAEDLKQLGIEPLYRCRVFELEAELELAGGASTRKLIVPAESTFEQLHAVLQAAFGWKNEHLYDFSLYKHPDQREPDVELVVIEDDLSFRGDKARLLDGLRLIDYFNEYTYFVYRYDFGDNWIHRIRVTGYREDYPEPGTRLLAGEGDTPPENVGGIPGYEAFLQVLSDPLHPEHDHYREWAKAEGYRPFQFERASHRVKYASL